ncbi:hypothetical protein A3A39_01590 [Candidatus Kaiserbacteria bacterium RIFCSPLOWO2_01_FULL_54_13]|uniref:PA14 domain-containing protein n=1 Tax=Candidatus Kaiserbacteria bacterium RIFCSPLOWO2_01_FULL_54_13 TaxID=1798512 RepID=A0A1F6F3W2_9BACT|nr:MAG: hypothetical protein A3A39_01590 [Candidatus Kaiserbacteria bacterium RIFCSPLOWO2_01_FULL_54_13]
MHKCFLGLTLLALSLGGAGDVSAQLQWLTCQGQPGGFHDSGEIDLKFQTRCQEMLIEDVLRDAPEELSRKLAEWEGSWNVLRFPPRVFRYEIVITAFHVPTDVLVNDTPSFMGFARSPYITVNRALIFRVPACHTMTISFLSPWPPKMREVRVFWTEASPGDEASWFVESTWPILIAVPDAWGNNPGAAQGIFHAEKPRVEPVTSGDAVRRCSPR